MASWHYPEKLSLALLPTPLQPLRRLGERLGTGQRIWVKRDDLTGCAVSGNKVRKLEFILADALARGADTIVTCGGIQSNHCRATAVLGAMLGLKVHLILRGNREDMDPLAGNLLLDFLCGAEVDVHPAIAYNTHFNELSGNVIEHYRRQGRNPYWITTGASDGVGIWGYINASRELKKDFSSHGIDRPYIICASGSGGTQAGLVAGNVLHDLKADVFGVNVCDNKDYFIEKIGKDLREWQAIHRLCFAVDKWPVNIIDRFVGEGYAKASDDLLAMIVDIARMEGLILDPVYTSKAFYGLLSELQAGRFSDRKDIVFIHTGGIFGLQPYSEQLARLLVA